MLFRSVLLLKKVIFHEAIMVNHGPLLFMAMLLILSGLQLLSVGLIGEMVTRTYFESQRKPIYAVREMILGAEELRQAGTGEPPGVPWRAGGEEEPTVQDNRRIRGRAGKEPTD